MGAILILQSLPNKAADVQALPHQGNNQSLALAATAALAATTLTWNNYSNYTKQLTWDWDTIKTDTTQFPAQARHFPQDFMWGVGTSSYQVEGNCTNSTYYRWQQSNGYKEPAGVACAHETHYKEDIARMKNELGVAAYRFSVEWSKIEPQEGVFDQSALNHYVDICAELEHGIRPVIEFHHYSDPQWFMDNGGFAQEKNIDLYVRMCTRVFQTLAQKLPELFMSKNIPYFLTFNSPASYAANGYLTGNRPLGMRSMQTMLEVLKNMLEAHVRVYQAVKKHPQGMLCKVGTTHNIYQLDPLNWFNPVHHLKAHFGNLLVHHSVYQFFTTGTFNITIPCKASVNHTNPLAPHSLDFIGLNYYCHGYMATTTGPLTPTAEIPTDNPQYTIYAEGLYRAIQEISDNLAQPLKIPIIITENGIGTHENATRDLFLKRYLYALAQALKDGYNVMGYIHWSLMDNFEWAHGYTIGYGLYHVDRSIHPLTGLPFLHRTLKSGARYFVDLIHQHNAAAVAHA